ncbi:MAG TPA: SHIRT domain-containing protein [Clostridia bacterium]|nr:SHIRT domain-containing protein [Clostridia bacterium]
MKHTKHPLLYAATLVILLVCFVLPSSALAASKMGNDNHTDTSDYCLRAHDVTVGLSEFSSKTHAELESDILSASAFTFLIRDTVSGTGDFVPITSGYSVDFSALTAAVSSSGYVITVSLSAISMPGNSTIQFRVFVTDDTPQQCAVHYTFCSGTAELALPADVTAQLPADETLPSGTTVTPSAVFSPVRDGAGMWTFSSWSPSSITLADSDVTFSGTWLWTALPVYTVSFEFVSGTSGQTLPKGVLDKLPMNTTGIDGDVITPPDTFRAYHMTEGTWRFYGWNLSSQTISGGNLTFIGEWRWHKIKVTAPPTAQITPAPTATPLPDATRNPIATPQSENSPDQPVPLPEPVQNNPQPPATSNPTGGTAQMVVATVLTALVAAQAFAIASDLKVLKWYNAKKAARRMGA